MTAIAPRTGASPLSIPTTARWKYSTTITKADPGVGNLRANNASWASATEVFVSATDSLGDNYKVELANILTGTTVMLMAGENTQGTFEAIGPSEPQASGAWFVVPVKYVEGKAPKNGTSLGVVAQQQTWWSLSAAGDVAEWDITDAGKVEVWIGGSFVSAVVLVEMRRLGFGWTTVRIRTNRSPQIIYSGEVVLPEGTVAVGASEDLVGAHRLRMTLKSIVSGSLNCDIAFSPLSIALPKSPATTVPAGV
jgi:hypothetical protein